MSANCICSHFQNVSPCKHLSSKVYDDLFNRPMILS
jgi:hypothetical protein